MPAEPIDWAALEAAYEAATRPARTTDTYTSLRNAHFNYRDLLHKSVPAILAYHKNAQDALNYAYQLAGVAGAGIEALDNLSAVAHGDAPPHPWPVAALEVR